MGLGNLIDDDINTDDGGSSNSGPKLYGGHEAEEELEEMVDELVARFPLEPEIEFIEVSPRMSKTPAKLYVQEKEDGVEKYIRVSEPFTSRQKHDQRKCILYLLAQAYFRELGFDNISPANDEFKWVCGQVGAPTNPIDTNEEAWRAACVPFLDDSPELVAPEEIITSRDGEEPGTVGVSFNRALEQRGVPDPNSDEVPPPENED